MANVSEEDNNPAQIGNLRRLALPFLIYGFVGNLVILVSPLFMMQVLDRVVPSGNLNTLIMLLIFALAVLILNAVVEFSRDRSLGRIVRWIDETCIQPIVKQDPDTRSARLSDLQTLHGFFSGRHPVNLIALAWLPLFLLCLALINPLYLLLIGLMFGTIFLVQTFSNSWAKEPKSQIQDIQSRESTTSYCLDQASRQIRADGAPQRMANQMLELRKSRLQLEDQTDAPLHFSAASSGALRLATQLFALSLGAYLVSQHMMTAGGMIAASVICGKVLSSLEGSLGSIREIRPARKAFANLRSLPVVNPQGLNLQAFEGKLNCSGLIFPRGAGAPPRLDRVSFELKSGECLAIIGDSGCGKTTLLNALSGISPAPIGLVQLDQTDIRHLDPVSREKVVGYAPQIPNFLNGTIAQNIAGFDPDASDAQVIDAAKLARSHGVFSSLKDGYHTDLSRDAFLLTTGQRQLLSLTAAVYQKPKYLFLDEPNSLLDQRSERALCKTLDDLKSAGTTIIMVLHRAGMIALADKVMVLDRGRIADFGQRSQVLGRQADQKRINRMPLRPSSIQDLSDWITGQFTRGGDAEFAAKAVLLGTELFQAAYLNGPKNVPREMQLEFKFIDDANCEIQMIEEGPNGAQKLLPRVRAALEEGSTDDEEMKPEERPLFLATQIASKLDITTNSGRSRFWARLTQEEMISQSGGPH